MQMKSGVVYVTTKQFDSYYCGCGRVTVNPGAMFCLKGDRVYFVNSKNYLPYEATNDFKNSFFDYEVYKKEVLYENKMEVSSYNIKKFNQDSDLRIVTMKNNDHIEIGISTPWNKNVSVLLTEDQVKELIKNLQEAIVLRDNATIKEELEELDELESDQDLSIEL